MSGQSSTSKAKARFDHCNINVTDTPRSLEFYDKALGLSPCGRIDGPDGAFIITYLTDGMTGFRLELTWLKDHPQPYDLGDNESHIALRTATREEFDALHTLHQSMGVVCFENPAMGIYFIEDPDGYWIEILPPE
ncbi:MAG: VOC family protein [Muribaculaceae bacterium]|nr:VOC family protein [Muribaculaceae bacterium]